MVWLPTFGLFLLVGTPSDSRGLFAVTPEFELLHGLVSSLGLAEMPIVPPLPRYSALLGRWPILQRKRSGRTKPGSWFGEG
ncbi:hypothetical protein HDK64DRAFT_274239 [Phyllosticta capitalensis]